MKPPSCVIWQQNNDKIKGQKQSESTMTVAWCFILWVFFKFIFIFWACTLVFWFLVFTSWIWGLYGQCGNLINNFPDDVLIIFFFYRYVLNLHCIISTSTSTVFITCMLMCFFCLCWILYLTISNRIVILDESMWNSRSSIICNYIHYCHIIGM